MATTLPSKEWAGNQEAFLELLEPVLPTAYRVALGMLRRPADAEDAVQDAVLNAWRHRGRLREDSDVRPWLLTIVANQCRMQRRNRWWRVLRIGHPATDAWYGSQTQTLDLDAAELRRALDRLTHNQQLVLVLRYYLDYTFEEIGRFLNISAKAAKSRTYRALERLRIEAPEVLQDE